MVLNWELSLFRLQLDALCQLDGVSAEIHFSQLSANKEVKV